MAVPYTFATATSSIPLSQLDANFATGITLGNTTVYLGNTTTSIGNLTLTNATISSVASTFPNSYLANSSVTIGSTNVSLGGTATTIAGLTLTSPTITGGTSTATQNLANVTGTLAVGNGGTGLTSLTAGYIPYGNGTSAFSSSANMTFNGTTLTLANDASISGLTVGKGTNGVAGNTVLGQSALQGANSGTGYNVAVGFQAGYSNTSGQQNIYMGQNAGYFITTGSQNIALGITALQGGSGTSTGSNNVAVGNGSLFSNTTASNNTAVGYQAGYTQAGNANGNTLLGYQAGYTGNSFIDVNSWNTHVGYQAGYSNTTGIKNTFIGAGAGTSVTTGYNNTILGRYNGNQGGLDIRTASNNVVLSDGDGNIAARWANGGGWYQLNNSASWSTTSDARIKENVTPITNGLDVILALNPVEFDYKLSKQHTAGFLAQDYEKVLPDQIIEDANISEELKALTNGEPVKGIQQNLVPYLVSAIIKLEARIKVLEAK